MTIEGIKRILLEKLEYVKGMDRHRQIYYAVPMLIAFHFGNHLSSIYRYRFILRWWRNTPLLMDFIIGALLKIIPSFHPVDMAVGTGAAAAAAWVMSLREKAKGKERNGREFGSAAWGRPSDIKPYINPSFHDNILLTKTERLTMESRPKDPKTARNKNVMVIGGSGSGKTRFYVKPNLMQMGNRVSYVVTDPKAQIIEECGSMLRRHGYGIKVFNTMNFRKSMRYNPFCYIHSEKDILKLVNVLIENTTPDGAKSSDPFWTSAERLLYCALIGYLWYEAPPEEQTLPTVLEMINACEVREDDESFKNPVDMLFDSLEERDPRHFAVRQYKKFKLSAGKTAKSILISCAARLAPFDIQEVREALGSDDMEFEKLGTEKTALFIIVSDTDNTFNFLAAMMYSQLFNSLCELADDKFQGRLPYHVRFLCDEFANLGKIPNFDRLIATIRSREISVSVILQSMSQLKTMYKDAADTISGNCDTMLFLGGKETSTLKEISELLGKETIGYHDGSSTKGNSPAYTKSSHITGRDLMSKDEISVMDGGKCILQIRGVRPFLSDKFDITAHPRYKELSDADKKNRFDVESYVRMRCKVRDDEITEVYVA